MRKLLLFTLAFALLLQAKSQETKNNYSQMFEKAYAKYPEIPRGVLEAVAYTNTRMQHIQHSSKEAESCTGIPNTYGIMGLTLDGKNYFKNNLAFISNISNYSIDEIISSPEKSIIAYAAAYASVKNKLKVSSHKVEEHMPILVQLSELPDNNKTENYALNVQQYAYYDFLNSSEYQKLYNLPAYKIDFISLFGAENYSILKSSQVTITDSSVFNTRGQVYQNNTVQSADYSPALWNAAATCNYGSRNGTAITAVAIHTVEGTYAGCISWFKNCNARASAHYVVRSSDGQITQMVLEKDKAWHLKTESSYTIGIEHEGYINNAAWYTNAMYTASASLVRDITNSGYGISPLRTYSGPGCTGSTGQCAQGGCTKIKGHQMFPAQTHTDPGPNWNWALYYNLINNNPAITTINNTNGNFYDSGGNTANYSNNERKLTLIQPSNALSVTINFSSFALENNYDYLLIYNGATTSAPLIGKYTGTNSPGTITSSGGALLLEFRSDCATTAAGWAATWKGNYPVPTVNINLASGTNPSETGTFLTFNAATTNFIAGATFQWKVNGANPTGTFTVTTNGSQSSFKANAITNGQVVTCELTQMGQTVLSNSITISRYAVYCAAGSNVSTNNLYISNVQLQGVSNPSGSSQYSNYNSVVFNVKKGVTSVMNVSMVNSPSQNIKVLIWVDWNDNKVFTDAGEKIYESGPGMAMFSSLLANITPPSFVSFGLKRMRIRLVNNSSNLSSCGYAATNSQGEVEDYSLNVVSATRSLASSDSSKVNVSDDSIKEQTVIAVDNKILNYISKQFVTVYPNPNEGIFTILFDKVLQTYSVVKIYSIDGKKVKEFSSLESIINVDISEQPAGIYFLEINQNGITLREKIVKNKN